MDAPIERMKEIVLTLTGLIEERDAEIERLKKKPPETPPDAPSEPVSQGPDTDKPDPNKPETWRV